MRLCGWYNLMACFRARSCNLALKRTPLMSVAVDSAIDQHLCRQFLHNLCADCCCHSGNIHLWIELNNIAPNHRGINRLNHLDELARTKTTRLAMRNTGSECRIERVYVDGYVDGGIK